MRIKFIIGMLVTNILCCAQEKPIILWDLHGVFFNQKNFIIEFLKSPSLYQIITHISWSFIKDLLHTGVMSFEYLAMDQKYQNPYLQNFLLKTTNDLSAIATMENLAHELAALGYEQQIASNISSTAFAQLINPNIFPQYASFFALFNLPASQTGHLSNGIAIKKPDPIFFQEYLAKNNLDTRDRHIIFIDDKQANIAAARAFGFDTILFKNPYQLRDELRSRGINVAPPPHNYSHQQSSHALYDVSLFPRQK